MYVEDSYLIDDNQPPLTYSASTLGPITLQTITRSVKDLNADITLTCGFTITNSIPSAGFVLLEVSPSYQAVFKLTDGALLTCTNTLNQAQAIKCYVYRTFIKVTDLCGTNTVCPANSQFNLVFSSGLRNPRFV